MYIHDLNPVLISFGFFEIRWYSLAYIFGILIGWWIAKKIIVLKSKNITVTSHYQPLHSSDFMQKIPDNQHDSCPVTTRVSNCIARLPLFFNMSDEQLQYVIENIHDFEF